MQESRKTRYTRMVLQDSLFELIEKKPINKITIKELCENADINRTTFYKYYTDQYDLLRKIEDNTLSWAKEAMNDMSGKTNKDEKMKVLEGIFQYFVENSRHIKILMSDRGNIDFQEQMFTLIYQECVIRIPDAENTDSDISKNFFAFSVYGSIGLLRYWLKNGINRSAKEMAEIIYKFGKKETDIAAYHTD